MAASTPAVMEGGPLQGESLVQLEVVTGGPRAVLSALAMVLTPSFDLSLIGSFLTCEAGGGAICQRPAGKLPSRTFFRDGALVCREGKTVPPALRASCPSQDTH